MRRGEAAQHKPGRDLVGGPGAAAQAAAAIEQLAERQPAQLFADPVWRGDDDRAQLAECFAAHVDGAAAGDEQQPQRFSFLTAARERNRGTRECCSCRPGSVERVVFAVQPPLGSRRAAELEPVPGLEVGDRRDHGGSFWRISECDQTSNPQLVKRGRPLVRSSGQPTVRCTRVRPGGRLPPWMPRFLVGTPGPVVGGARRRGQTLYRSEAWSTMRPNCGSSTHFFTRVETKS